MGIKKASLLYHYPSKQELHRAVLDRRGEQALRERADELLPPRRPEATDVVLCWDLLNYLGLPAIAALSSRLAARAAEQEDEFELPYDAVILPEGGVRLLQLAPLLPFYDVDPREVRFLGTSLWRDPETAREPSLAGGWFPGPDADALEVFSASYRRVYGSEPSRLAPLAYDAVLMTASLTRGMGAVGLTPQGFERPTGFRGADGLFRFGEDRISEHALAVYQVRRDGFVVIDPAPDSFEPLTF